VLNTIQQEVWRPVKEFPTLYKVSNTGKVASYRKELAQHIINSGYVKTSFKIAGKNNQRLVHRIVAEAFIDNPDNKREVNHKDGNRLNNHASNLEWMTSSENKQHARKELGSVYNVPTLGLKLSKASKYYNVGYDKSRKKWKSCVRVDNVNYHQKRFDTEEEAALHVNWIIDTLGLTDRPKNVVELKA